MKREYNNYYLILGIKRNATYKEIKKAYQEKAKLFHPDLNKSPNAEADMKLINEAKEILLNYKKRQRYDFFIETVFQNQKADISKAIRIDTKSKFDDAKKTPEEITIRNISILLSILISILLNYFGLIEKITNFHDSDLLSKFFIIIMTSAVLYFALTIIFLAVIFQPSRIRQRWLLIGLLWVVYFTFPIIFIQLPAILGTLILLWTMPDF